VGKAGRAETETCNARGRANLNNLGLELEVALDSLSRNMQDEFLNRAAVKVGATSDGAASGASATTQADRTESLRRLAQELARHESYLRELAQRYNWWQSPTLALQFPARLVAQVMNLGTFADISELARTLGDDCLRGVLASAEAGQLSPRSWHYWHFRLNNVRPGQVPPMPGRRIA
jgi:hypothetical protein